jgi:hypothetical protein
MAPATFLGSVAGFGTVASWSNVLTHLWSVRGTAGMKLHLEPFLGRARERVYVHPQTLFCVANYSEQTEGKKRIKPHEIRFFCGFLVVYKISRYALGNRCSIP